MTQINRLMLQFWPIPTNYINAVEYYKACAMHLAAHAEADGVVITIERKPMKPLAMRNHVAHIEVREKR